MGMGKAISNAGWPIVDMEACLGLGPTGSEGRVRLQFMLLEPSLMPSIPLIMEHGNMPSHSVTALNNTGTHPDPMRFVNISTIFQERNVMVVKPVTG